MLLSLGTLLVWVAYLHAFLAGYRRQRTGTILITLGQGRGLGVHCLVTNMSAEPVYVLSVIASVEGDAGVRTRAVTEPEGEQWSEPSDLRLWTRQGPLDRGALRDMGSVAGIVDHVLGVETVPDNGAAAARRCTAGLRRLRILMIAVHGAEDLLLGAERSFDIVEGATGPGLHPCSHDTRQIRARRERRRLARMLETVAEASPGE